MFSVCPEFSHYSGAIFGVLGMHDFRDAEIKKKTCFVAHFLEPRFILRAIYSVRPNQIRGLGCRLSEEKNSYYWAYIQI